MVIGIMVELVICAKTGVPNVLEEQKPIAFPLNATQTFLMLQEQVMDVFVKDYFSKPIMKLVLDVIHFARLGARVLGLMIVLIVMWG